MKNATRVLYTLFIILCSPLAQKAQAQSLVNYFIAHSYDVCGTYVGYVKSTGYAPGQTLKCHWGDGLADTFTVTPWTVPGIADTGYTHIYHSYTTPGTYSIKMVLYDGSPYDSVIVAQEVTHCHYLQLSAKVDVNANCIPDGADSWVHTSSTIQIDSAGIPVDTLSMVAGLWYRAAGPPGTIYTIRQLTPPTGLTLACGGTGILYDTIPLFTPTGLAPVSDKYLLYNCMPPGTAFDLGVSASFVSAVLPNFHRATIQVSNTSCDGVPAMLRYDFSPKYAFDSVDMFPALSYTVAGTSVTFDFGSMSVHTPVYMYVYLHPVVTLVAGDTVNSFFTVTPITGDAHPANNIVVRCDTIRLSWDPNQKSVTPTGPISAGTRLEYMLEFENMGNDTAHNIHILDTLSDYLDLSTLTQGVSTHNVRTIQYRSGAYNIVKFDFPNIMLPDSSHHEFCKGMVTFSINAKPTLAPGTTIANRCGIYFDFNEVVMTNTVYSHIPLPTGVKHTDLSLVELYPNPVADRLNITMPDGGYSSLSVYNVMGQKVLAKEIRNDQVSVSVSDMAPGIYYATLRGINGSRTIKFEKL